jgi:hypothetical protein
MYGVRHLVCSFLSHFGVGYGVDIFMSVLGPGKLRISCAGAAISSKYVDFRILGNLRVLMRICVAVDGQLFVVPFAKSATTGQHSPVRSISMVKR